MLMRKLTAFCHLFSPLQESTSLPPPPHPPRNSSVSLGVSSNGPVYVRVYPPPPRPSTAHINRLSVNVYWVFSYRGSPRLRTPAVLCDVTHVAAGTTKFHKDLPGNLSLSILENNWKKMCYGFGFLPAGPFCLRKSRFLYLEIGI